MAAEERRASIIDATLPLLRDRGRAVSTKEISKAAGIAEGTIFRVFSTKDELIHACIHQAFDTRRLRVEIQAIDLALPLAERLTAAVEIMQAHLRGIFSLMMTLQSTGQPFEGRGKPDRRGFSRERSVEEIDEDFVALLAPDRDRLRVEPETVVGYVRMLTLASVHPFLNGQSSTAAELVDVVLEGALRRSPTADPAPPTSPANPTRRGK
jgi:AcrR family transcriptional regulator